MMYVYGIKNCDTVKKAVKFLQSIGMDYTFVDLKYTIPDADIIQAWVDALGADVLINTRGTTWRALSDLQKAEAMDTPIPYIQDNTSLIKRPLFVYQNGDISVGFTKAIQEKLDS